MKRRGFLSALCAALVTPDPDKLLWKPGARLISIPSGNKLINARDWSLWFSAQKNPTPLEAYIGFGIVSWPNGIVHSSADVHARALKEMQGLDSRYSYCQWVAYDGADSVKGEIICA